MSETDKEKAKLLNLRQNVSFYIHYASAAVKEDTSPNTTVSQLVHCTLYTVHCTLYTCTAPPKEKAKTFIIHSSFYINDRGLP